MRLKWTVEVVELPEITRRQLLLWAVIGIVIIIIGGKYLLSGDGGRDSPMGVAAATVSLKQAEDSGIKVHVVGAVVRPGLYDLKQGDRSAEAIDAAGGPTPAADLSRVNLAAKVADGQQLVVPAAGDGTAGPAGSPADGGGPVNLNSASVDELTSLDGIGPKTAQKIIDYREEHGGFANVEELLDVPGIGPAKFDQIKGEVIV